MNHPSATSNDDLSGIGQHRVLNAGMRKWLMAALISCAFVALGIVMIIMKGDFLAWFLTAFFAIMAAVAALQFTGAGSKLTLDADTFTITNFGRDTTERWDDCANFSVYRLTRTEEVVYDRARDVETHMGEMNRSITGRSASLPDTFDMKPQNLANLMNAYQANAVERSWQRHVEAVADYQKSIAADLSKSAAIADVITVPAAMNLPEGVSPWPAILVVDKAPRPDGTRRILIAADILSPESRWIPEHTKRDQAFEVLEADELQIITPETDSVRRIPRN